MAAAAARAWAGAASRGAGRPPSRGTGRPRRLRFVTPLLWVVMALSATAAPDAAAEEPAASSSSMLRRRQVDDPAAAGGAGATEAAVAINGAVVGEAPVLGMDAVDLDDLDLWGQGQAAAFEEGGDKGWFTGGGGGPQWPKCAWAGTLTRNISNIFALEDSAAYHFLAPWFAFQGHGGGVPTFRISGAYPRTAFFDFAAYNGRYLTAIDAIADYKISPSWGKNPFAEACTPEEVGTYEVYATLHGDKGYPNEIRLLKNATDLAARSYLTPVIMRLYGRDPTMDTHDFDHRVWGGVAPPKVEYLGADGKWVEVPQCTDQQRDFPARVIERVYRLGQGIDTTRLPGQLSYRGDCPTRSIGNGLVPGMLVHGGSLDVIPVSFQNAHSVYAYWCMSPHVKEIEREEFFIKLKTRLPVIPHTLFGGGEESSSWRAPRIWERHAYDTRFVSITTMNLNVPHNVFDSITGIEIERFYRARQGAGWDRRVTIVSGLTQAGVDACGMLDRDSEIWLNWSDGDDASLHQFRVPHITYRDINSAVDTVHRPGRTATDVKRTCTSQAGAWNDCNNWRYVQQVMQDLYPTIEIWSCDRATGHATQLA